MSMEAAGKGGLASDELAAWTARTATALDDLAKAYRGNTLALLRLPEETGDFEAIEALAAHLRAGTTDVVVLGIGGSSLGAKALAQLAFDGTPAGPLLAGARNPRVHFFENLDPFTFEEALAQLDLRTTRFLVISKSGGTAEPLAQALAARHAIEAAGGGKYLDRHFAVITGPADSPLRRFAGEIGAPVLDHPPDVGGRYSCLTCVGLVPALLLGLDIAAVRAGARAVVAQMLAAARPEEVPAGVGAAVQVGFARERDARVSVMMAYSDRLERFGLWYRQLWAESLGKAGQGTLPATGIGPVDQHSQLQLYLDGPADKVYTLLHVASRAAGPRVETADEALGWLSGHTMGDLLEAEYRATVETLIARGRPVRTLTLDRLDERSMGALMMHFMLETIIAAHLLGVDPFGQPAVEEGKVRARETLARMG